MLRYTIGSLHLHPREVRHRSRSPESRWPEWWSAPASVPEGQLWLVSAKMTVRRVRVESHRHLRLLLVKPLLLVQRDRTVPSDSEASRRKRSTRHFSLMLLHLLRHRRLMLVVRYPLILRWDPRG